MRRFRALPLCLAGCWLLFLHLLVSPQAGAQPANFTLDFEEGTLRGWRPTGSAFRHQPTLGDNPTARNRGQPSGHAGRYWIGTYEKYQGKRGQRPGNVQGDGPTGSLLSPPFRVPKGTLGFLIGGGRGTDTGVELLILGKRGDPDFYAGGQRVYAAHGRNTESMTRIRWDLSPHAGKEGRLRIFDYSSGGWGHVNVDDFRFEPPRSSTGYRTVPDVMRMGTDAALARLRRPGLNPVTTTRQTDGHPDNTVISQNPAPGSRVKPGARVELVIARAIRFITVPGVVGLQRQTAIRRLERLRLEPAARDRQTDEAPENTVVAQKPPPGARVTIGTRVDVTVAVPEERVTVPGLVGMQKKAAFDRLKRVRLEPASAVRQTDEKPENTVVAQKPPAGARVKIGTRVDVTVAVPEERVIVPGLVGMQKKAAFDRLKRVRLEPASAVRQTDEKPENTVVAQKPPAGARVKIGTRVDVTVAVPEKRVTVPAVVGMQKKAALDRLKRVRLEPASTVRQTDEKPENTVVAQHPPPGSRVKIGTRVNVTVAVPEERVIVPGLVGMQKKAAFDRLKRVRLEPASAVRQTDEKPENTVVAQKPPAGARVKIGTRVDVTVAVPEKRVTVPAVVGMQKKAALDRLTRVRLEPEAAARQTDEKPENTVVAQKPPPGARVKIGTRVDVTVAVPEKRVTVPAVVGMQKKAAFDRLTRVRLEPAAAARQTDEAPENTVVAQRPPAGAAVRQGTRIHLSVAAPIPGKTVPDITGRTRPQAQRILEENQLSAGRMTTEISDETAGRVIRQAPTAGVPVSIGTPVDLVFSESERTAFPWLPAAVAIALCVGVGCLIYRRKRLSGKLKPDSPVTIRPNPDRGVQHLTWTGASQQDAEVRIKTVGDPGVQEIDIADTALEDERKRDG